MRYRLAEQRVRLSLSDSDMSPMLSMPLLMVPSLIALPVGAPWYPRYASDFGGAHAGGDTPPLPQATSDAAKVRWRFVRRMVRAGQFKPGGAARYAVCIMSQPC